MRIDRTYVCRVCKINKAIMYKFFITKTLKFRAGFKCLNCKCKFEVTVNGNSWNFSTAGLLDKMNSYIVKLINETKILVERR